MQKKKKISGSERDQIAVMLASGLSLRDIAKELDRGVSSISDEIKRNSVKEEYKSIATNSLSLQRNRQSRKTNPLKNPKIFSLVFDKLREGWSPEQIAGRLKRLNKGKTVICHETIYQYIYSPEGKKRHLHEYLVRHIGKEDLGMAGIFTGEELPIGLVSGSDQRKLTTKRLLVIGKQMWLREKLTRKEYKPYWKGKPDFIKQSYSSILIRNLGLKPKKIF